MIWTKTFEELDSVKHERESFDCGAQELNVFLRTLAAKHMQTGISRTMVLPSQERLQNDKNLICSFYTVAPGSIQRETLPHYLSKKLPHYPVPVFLLTQLAVHKSFHGKGLGKITLVKALEFLWQVNSHMRAYAVVVDCLNEEAQNFYLRYGFEQLCVHNGRARLFLGMKTIGQLF